MSLPTMDSEQLLALNNRYWEASLHGQFYPLAPPGPDPEARRQLRRRLVSRLESRIRLGERRKQLLKPGTPPRLRGVAISISHCRNFAGFIFELSHHTTLGLDIEQKSRVTPKLTRYISSREELSLAPSAASLWGAKEATFKAIISPGRKVVLSDIRIGDWYPLPPDSSDSAAHGFRFDFHGVCGGGHVFEWDDWVFTLTRTQRHCQPETPSGIMPPLC